MSVDGVDFRVFEPKPFNPRLFSHKFHAAGLRYETGVSIQSGDLIWINGPFAPGLWPDLEIFRSSLMGELQDDERVEADRGYRGEPLKIDAPDDMIDGELQRLCKSTVRARHETIHSRMRRWSILGHVFRHAIQKHEVVFRAVAVLTQLGISSGDRLFHVNYKTLGPLI